MLASTLKLEPLDRSFGAVVHGVNLAALDGDEVRAIQEAWIEYGLLIFPGQFLSRSAQNAFARQFGELEFAAAPISNVDRDGRVHHDGEDDLVKQLRGNEGWHHDSTYMPLMAKGAVFTAEIVPPTGGETGWADMRAAYEALDADTRTQIQDSLAYHSLYYSQARAGYLPKQNEKGGYDMYGYHDKEPSLRPLVKIHPDTGRPNLLIGRHAYGIVGMDPEASERLLDRLAEQACAADRVYYHHWSPGDAVLWDNRRLMHRATPFDMTQPRRMWHARIAGDPASELALNHEPGPGQAT